MPDYKEMYLTMVRASEKAINILAEAQQVCEELYIGQEDDPSSGETDTISVHEKHKDEGN